VEDAGGRQRHERWSPRTIDIDILIYGDLVLEEENLCIPHPALEERAFVVLPLRDIAPHLRLSTGESLAEIATQAGILKQPIRLYTDVSTPNKTEEKSL
jgi:2-amino-4-hydroxy-6-hydroxymethyldihydropteridine diphosphokinase